MALGNREWQRRDGLPIPLTAETGHGLHHCKLIRPIGPQRG